jgi:hypothetical protein
MRRLRPLIDAVGSAETVSENVFVAEVHGYHSVKYRHQSALLPSQAYTIHLVRRAIDRDAQFLIMRAGSIWLDLVPELRDARCVRLNSAQNVTVSPRNCPAGFATIVARVRES